MTESMANQSIRTAFVTGATGLLGNNLVRLLVSRGSPGQSAGPLTGKSDPAVSRVTRRDRHGRYGRKKLHTTNVRGTTELLHYAYAAGVRRVVHTSSVAVLRGAPSRLTNETMLRTAEDADDYYLSKILTDRAVSAFLERHPDLWACFVLPGWMIGPGDMGPTSSGQIILDFVHRQMPGIPPATFSVVDARDVAEAHWLASEKGSLEKRAGTRSAFPARGADPARHG